MKLIRTFGLIAGASVIAIAAHAADKATEPAKKPAKKNQTGVVLETKYVHVKRSFSGILEQKGNITITIGADGARTESPKSKVIETFLYEPGPDKKPRDVSYYMNKNNKTYERRDLETRRQEDARLRAGMNR